MKRIQWIIPFVLVLSLAGCEGAYRARRNTRADLENRESVVVLTSKLRDTIAVESQRAKWSPANLLEIQARLRNRTEKPVQVEVQTVFKDADGFSTNDNTVWTRMLFEPNETKIYRVNSLNTKARRFTIRIRETE